MTFSLDTNNINDMELETLRKVLALAKHAHFTDIKMRINGEDKLFQADWLKWVKEI